MVSSSDGEGITGARVHPVFIASLLIIAHMNTGEEVQKFPHPEKRAIFRFNKINYVHQEQVHSISRQYPVMQWFFFETAWATPVFPAIGL